MIKTKRHPATYGIGAHDVRTSLRYDEHNPEDAILTAIHEGGHGIAAQGIPDEYYGMPIGTKNQAWTRLKPSRSCSRTI